ncbi:MAG: LysR family transcriptional regulator, partial [Proteobacteria bacterium]
MIREHADIAGQMLLFAHAVEHGSLSAAARDLALSPSAVSKQIRRLEDRLGVRLLNRSTRRITLTDEGRAFYDRCSRVASEVAEAESVVSAMGTRVQGTLRVVATVAFAKAQLLPLFSAFMKTYPDLSMELELTDRTVDLVEENVDVAIRFSEQLDDPSVVVRTLAPNRRVICAAPSYLSLNGVPQRPEDLLGHNCLRLSTVQSWNDWEFDCADGCRVLQVKGNFEANSADAIYHSVLAGLGIARLSTYLVAHDLAEGRLVRVLPKYTHDKS